ncbi:putative ATP-dependent DNA helicase/translocase [Weissella oryzae SG25]|uniref:Putative ATP-dependent DNA helicase/translocase n=1 Tax=Weissella oryzae (strain DSM 25784 / JCM 18191 / LMG 30913 / SG25) TaxID=1329250 RepID=A0A069CVK3_WEIOS|nr:helicase-related protein [Weissella oryzae]GAK31514.1 putative ATP-dependent DNA helicase/translocase [Weissella oryzae SG25]
MYLLHHAELHDFSSEPILKNWSGRLTEQQELASKQLRLAVSEQRASLVEAITGAGKTEILFESLDYSLKIGWRIALLSPRIDVLCELAPRLLQAFKGLDICLLHGKSSQPYHYSQLLLATTHQILRFKAAFDLIIIDEADAFPLINNQTLWRAIERAKLLGACTVYLTATPNWQLKQSADRRIKLFRRYHGYPLVKLEVFITSDWRKALPVKLKEYLIDNQASAQQLLLFVPTIADIRLVLEQLKEQYGEQIVGLHAADTERLEKVAAFRLKEITILVTTTVLERGVSFSNVDVIILGADEAVFNSATLMQIVGRVGRHQDYPNGRAWAFVKEHTWRLKQVCNKIRRINRIGRQNL